MARRARTPPGVAVLFGSVARGDAREDSDIDLLVVAEGWPASLAERRRPLLAEWERVRKERHLPVVAWNLVTKTPEEARHHSPLYLDLVEGGILIVDRRAVFRCVLDGLRARMRAATVVRKAQEAVELLLKGALRLAAVEPARTHDVTDLLRRESGRFPSWFGEPVNHLAAISTEMAGDRGIAFYGDERHELGPQISSPRRTHGHSSSSISWRTWSDGCSTAWRGRRRASRG